MSKQRNSLLFAFCASFIENLFSFISLYTCRARIDTVSAEGDYMSLNVHNAHINLLYDKSDTTSYSIPVKHFQVPFVFTVVVWRYLFCL